MMKSVVEERNRYGKRYRKGAVSNDVWQYIPQKVSGSVSKAFADADGYWIYFVDCEGCGTIHEYTVTGLKDAIKTIRKGK